MSERRKVPVAYVTKWVTARGIVVVKGEEGWTTDGKEYLTGRSSGSSLFVGPGQWTEDKAEAEKRYIAALVRAEKSLLKRLKDIRQAISDGPRYTEES